MTDMKLGQQEVFNTLLQCTAMKVTVNGKGWPILSMQNELGAIVNVETYMYVVLFSVTDDEMLN